jgi:hypothetical protein
MPINLLEAEKKGMAQIGLFCPFSAFSLPGVLQQPVPVMN